MLYHRGEYVFDVVEIARYTSTCYGCARVEGQVAPEELFRGEFEALKALGVPEIPMETFDEIFMEEVKELNKRWLEMMKSKDQMFLFPD